MNLVIDHARYQILATGIQHPVCLHVRQVANLLDTTLIDENVSTGNFSLVDKLGTDNQQTTHISTSVIMLMFCIFSRYGIISTRVPGMTAADTTNCHQRPAKNAMCLNGFYGVA